MSLYSRASTTMSVLFSMTGDWNAKAGKRSNNMPVKIASEALLVAFEIIVDNKHLVNFCVINSLFISNTDFQQITDHVTVWENKRVHYKALTKIITVYNQIEAHRHQCQKFQQNRDIKWSSLRHLQAASRKLKHPQKFKQNTQQHLPIYKIRRNQKCLPRISVIWNALYGKISERISPIQQRKQFVSLKITKCTECTTLL